MSDPLTGDPIGEVIGGRYEIIDILARGGQGLVYRARDQRSGEMVAVKTLSDVGARDPQHAQRFSREQQALQALEGTAVVKVLDTCRSSSGALCLVMELLQGRDLEEFLEDLEKRNERMSLEQIAVIMGPIVDTLEKAHRAGIFHRDLKPANIFIMAGGGVRLLDFGFARLKAAAPLTAVGTVMGSPSYIAPEVWRGRPDLLDHRVDVYSLAVIFFRMFSGQLPFESDSIQQMLLFATTAKRPSLKALRPDLPADVDDWVDQSLAIDPNERFRTVRALYNGLFAALQEDVPTGSPKRGWAGALQAAAHKLKRWAIADVLGKEASAESRHPETDAAQPAQQPAPSLKAAPTMELTASDLEFDTVVRAEPKPPPPRPKAPFPRLPPPPRPRTNTASGSQKKAQPTPAPAVREISHPKAAPPAVPQPPAPVAAPEAAVMSSYQQTVLASTLDTARAAERAAHSDVTPWSVKRDFEALSPDAAAAKQHAEAPAPAPAAETLDAPAAAAESESSAAAKRRPKTLPGDGDKPKSASDTASGRTKGSRKGTTKTKKATKSRHGRKRR